MTNDDAVASAALALRGHEYLTPALRQRIADQLEALVAEIGQLRRRAGERHTVAWSPELDARVLALLAAGLSYRVMAVRVSAETGRTISKGAVVGRAHRLAAPPRPAEFMILAAEDAPDGARHLAHGARCHADAV